jgi:hypothetical protein
MEKFEIYQKKLNLHIFNKNFKEIQIKEKKSIFNINEFELRKLNTEKINNNIIIEDNEIKDNKSSKIIKSNFIKFKAKSNYISIGHLKKNEQKNFLRQNTFNMKYTFNDMKGKKIICFLLFINIINKIKLRYLF